MPLLAGIITAILPALATWLARFFAARVAIKLAGLAAIAGFGTALMVTFNGIIAPLVAAAFSTAYGQVIGLAFPPIAGTCLAGIATLWVACTTYRLQEKAVHQLTGL